MTLKDSKQPEKESEFPIGEYFVYEPTGSATHINVDTKNEYDAYLLTEEHASGGNGRNPLAE